MEKKEEVSNQNDKGAEQLQYKKKKFLGKEKRNTELAYAWGEI